MKNKIWKWVLYILPAALVVVLDQITKVWAVGALKDQESIVLIKGALEFSYVENTGMAFGLMKDSQLFFYVATGIALAALVYFVVKIRFSKRFFPLVLILSFVSGGAVGNLIDRIVNKYVVDFIYVSLINFPVFNVADICVTLGCITLVVLILFVYKDEELKPLLPFGKKKTNK